jgi:hypothetical protein
MKRVIAGLVFLLAASPLRAQAPSPSHLQAAEDLIRVMRTEEMLKKGTERMLEAQAQQDPSLSGVRDIVDEFMAKALDWQELKPEFVRLYAETYTEAELRQLVAFYQTPLGQRVVETMPDLMARSSEISQRRVREFMPEMMQRIIERMQSGSARPDSTRPRN